MRLDCELTVDELVSPLRYDVVIRAQFVTFLRQNDVVRLEDPARFSALARQQPYHAWFRYVAMRGVVPAGPVLDARFDAQVARVQLLRERHEANGPSPRHPIQVWDAVVVLPTSTGKLVQRRYFVGDGCHRLALLLLDGVAVLRQEQVVVHRVRRFSPRDNTGVLLRHLALSDEDYYSYLARGYGIPSPVTDRRSLMTAASLLPPVRGRELADVLDVDDRLRTQ